MAISRTQTGPEIVLIPNPFTGQLAVKVPTAADPSPESQRLTAALAALADPEAEVPPATLWDDAAPDARHAKWLGEVELALENRAITTKESASLLEAFGAAARARGWLGEAGQRDLQALVRTRLGAGGRG